MSTEELSKVERVLIEKFGRLDIENVEKAYEKFSTGHLEQFDRALTVEEFDDLMVLFSLTNDSETQAYYFRQEEKYLEFFRYLFKKNGHVSIYAYCPELASKRKAIFRFLKPRLNKQEWSLFKKVKNNLVPHNGIFEIKSFEHLEIFAKLSLRELHFSNFFFEESVLIGNYELSLPLYCFEESYIKECQSKANEVDLFIRTEKAEWAI
ncbi:hypothetical protein [Viridibacillus arvi]|uniref:hypothetical protein n=1 Tax=Viridibacillus arvi TaxID=263475 RepID=UPI0036E52E4D